MHRKHGQDAQTATPAARTKLLRIGIAAMAIAALACALAVSSGVQAEDLTASRSAGIEYVDGMQTKTRATPPINPSYSVKDQDLLADNPERGFYSSSPIVLGEQGLLTASPIVASNTSKLLYLKVDMSAFSGSMNGTGTDKELTAQAIAGLESVLEKIKQKDNTIILRFVYDNNATGVISGVDKCEPSQAMLLRHVQQLSGTFKKYASTINVIQCGFYGLWGEAYYNTDAASTPSNYQELIPALLDATEGTDIRISVRTPEYYSWYRGCDIEAIDDDVTEDNEGAYRVGVFNDAYGAAWDDLGTYKNRERETDWLSRQSEHTYYGGEAITDTGSYSALNGIGPFNTAMNFIDEAYKLHTSYLNWEWNQALHKEWQNQLFTGMSGVDEKYNGMTGLRFIENHLGYRFVMRSSSVSVDESNMTLSASVGVENTGFGNLLKEKQADIVLTRSDGKTYEIADVPGVDATSWLAGASSPSTDSTGNVPLPQGIENGEYSVYLRISSGEKLASESIYSAVMFANPDIWSPTNQANLIGSVTITGGAEPVKPVSAFAVYSSTDSSLRFYKRSDVPEEGSSWDDGSGTRTATKVYVGIETASYAWNNLPEWNSIVDGDGGLARGTVRAEIVDDGLQPVSTAFWFQGKAFAAVEGLDKLDTSNVTNMQQMFYGNWAGSTITELDLSSFDFGAVSNMAYMFADCTSLRTVYVSDSWDPSKASGATDMFRNCSSIVGGNGTTWSGDDPSYRRIDRAGAPGYLTYKGDSFKDCLYYVNDAADWSARPFGDTFDGATVQRFDKSSGAKMFDNATWGIPDSHDVESVVVYDWNGAEKATYNRSELGEDYCFVRQAEPDLSKIGGQSVLGQNNGALRFVVRVKDNGSSSQTYSDTTYSAWTYDVWGGTNELSESFSNKAIASFNKIDGARIFDNATWGVPDGWEVKKVAVYAPNDTWISSCLAIYVKTTWTSDNGTTHERPADFVFKRQDVSDLSTAMGIDNGNLRFLIFVSQT